jgi:hypothetical protein
MTRDAGFSSPSPLVGEGRGGGSGGCGMITPYRPTPTPQGGGETKRRCAIFLYTAGEGNVS